MRGPLVWLGAISSVLLGCAAEIGTTDNNVRLNPGERIVLREVRFDYDAWSNQDPDFLAEARQSESGWREAIQSGYQEASSKYGFERRNGEEVGLSIAVVDLDPGSALGRTFLSADSDAGIVAVIATCEGRGSLRVGATLGDEDVFGSFDGTLEDLGAAVADSLAGR